MSEQPTSTTYEQHDRGAVFRDDNVIDLQKARPDLKSYAEVEAARLAEQAAREIAIKHSIERPTGELTVADASLALSNLNKVRRNRLEAA